jgi:hypothetical protein
MRHFVLTRSAYSADYPIEANRRRLALLQRVTVPAMRAQAERRWTWLVLVDPADPLLEQRMAAFGRSGVPVVSAKGLQGPWRPDASIPDGRMLGDVSGPWQTAVAALAGSDTRILTTRIDDDDALTPDALARIRRAADPATPGMRVWMLPRGYRFHHGRVQPMNHRSNMFATLESPSRPLLRVVMDVKHNDLGRLAPVRYIDERPAWLWVRHADARSGSRAAVQPPTLVRRLFPIDWAFLGSLR